MGILGGNQKHQWSKQTVTEDKKNTTYEGYTLEGDIAGQLIEEDSIKDVCPIDDAYYKKHKRSPLQFIKNFITFLKSSSK